MGKSQRLYREILFKVFSSFTIIFFRHVATVH